ncbi:MAG: response regulator [Cyanophyceae cyanobacterium]
MTVKVKDRSLNVLLVEDDKVDVMNIRRAFAKNDFESSLHVAENGLEALSLLRNEEESSVPSKRLLILLDLNMPKMGGIEFLDALRHDDSLKKIPVIVLTTSNEERDRIEAYKFNVAGYIVKPVTFSKFLSVTKALNEYWSLCEMP